MRVHYVNHLRSVPLASTKVQFTRVQSPHDIYTLFDGTVTNNKFKQISSNHDGAHHQIVEIQQVMVLQLRGMDR